jgi:high affinity Mn2+ porin
MSDHVLGIRRRIPCIGLGIVLLAGMATADAADRSAVLPALPSFVPDYAWTGWYGGVHLAYARGNARTDLATPAADAPFGSLYGGVQLGYNYLLPSHVLLGVETDISFPNYIGADDVAWSGVSANGNVTEQIDYIGGVRGRIGYAPSGWLVYATAGFAYSNGRFNENPFSTTSDVSKVLAMRTGWTAGGGIETAFDRNWTARFEYLYSQFGTTDVLFPSGTHYSSAIDLHSLRFGLNRKLGWDEAEGAGRREAPPLPVEWEIHGQSTYIQQGYPGFRSPYYGTNSFTPWPQTRETWSNSAFLGVKLWDGAEFYYNPELIQGYGLNATFGVAGFPNGEAQKSNFAYPHYITSRLFIRQTIGLGGDQESVESDYGQMAGKRDISRLSFQVGKFAVHDMFDNNAYASDPRTQFQNWSIWAAGAFDYPGDMVGLTYGAVAELNQRDWAVRGGYFLVVKHPNTNDFDMDLGRRGGYVGELETRYSLLTRPGKLRVIVWMHDTLSGGYRDAINLAAVTPGLDLTDAIEMTQRGRIKYGYVFNVEQSITDDIGMFGRWSWNNGTNQISAFTDIDASLSLGTSIKGTTWGRADDTVGFAGAINAISKDHRDYLAGGGMGILIGDGQLNYRQEKVLEAYYAVKILKDTTFTFDYQFMVNPAYNADRGPISFFSGRLHAQF